MALKLQQPAQPETMTADTLAPMELRSEEFAAELERALQSVPATAVDPLQVKAHIRTMVSPDARAWVNANAPALARVNEAADSISAFNTVMGRSGQGETTTAASKMGKMGPVQSFGDFISSTAFPTAWTLASKGADRSAILGAMALDIALMAAGGAVGKGAGRAFGSAVGKGAEVAAEMGGTALQTKVAGEDQNPAAIMLSGAIPLRREIASGVAREPGALMGIAGKAAQGVGAERVGAQLVAAGETLEDLPGKVKELLTKEVPRVSEFPKLQATARELGLDADQMPAALEFGLDSPPAMLERKLMQGNESGAFQKFKEFQDAAQKGIRDAVDNIGTVLQPSDAGELIRTEVLSRIKGLGDEAGTTFAKVASDMAKLGEALYLPPELTAKLDGVVQRMDAQAKAWAESPIAAQRAEAPRLREYADALLQARHDGGYEFARLNKVRELLGDEAFGNPALAAERLPKSVKMLREAYSVTSEGLVDAVDEVAPEVADDLREANKFLTDMLTEKDILAKSIGTERGEKAGSTIFAAATRDERKLLALRRLMSPEAWDSVRASVVASKLYANAADEVKFASSSRNLRRELQKSAGLLLTPAEQQRLLSRFDFGFRLGETVRPGEYASIGLTDRIRAQAEQALREQRLKAAQAYAKGAESGIAARAPARAAGAAADVARAVGRNYPAAAGMGLAPLPFGFSEQNLAEYEQEKSRGPR